MKILASLMLLALASIAQAQAAPSVFSSDVQMCSGRPWIDITCNGADPTGVADSTTAISNTMSTAVTNDWPIFFPAGTYKVSSKLTLEFGGQANNGPQIISQGATIDGRTITSGNVLQVQCSGGTTASPVVCNHFGISGWLTIMGSGAGYVAIIGKTDFSDQQNGVRIEHLVASNAGSGGAIQANYLTDSDLWFSGSAAGGSSSVGAVSLEQVQNSKVGGYASALGASAPGLLIENGASVGDAFIGFGYNPSNPTCVSITSSAATRNSWITPYFPCTTAINASTSANQNLFLGPTFAGTNAGATSTGAGIVGRGSLNRYLAPAVSSRTLVGTDDGTIFSSANGTGPASGFAAASLPITLPNPAQVGSGWTVGFVTDMSKAVTLSTTTGSILVGNQAFSNLTVGGSGTAINYETAVIQSDGTNFRVLHLSQASALINDAQTAFPARWYYPGGPGYSATLGDDGGMISSGQTSGGLTVTLPQAPTLQPGWMVGLNADNGKILTVQVNGTSGGNITINGTATSSLTVQNGNNAVLQFDGANFRLLTKASSQAQWYVTDFGALGNGSIDDSQAIANAFKACSAAGGGEVVFTATGSGYVIQHANLITAQETGPCAWRGYAGHYWPNNFYDNTASHWMAKGAWIWCQDTGNPCAELTTPGQKVVGLNFWYTQPTPSATTCSAVPCAYGVGWTPTTYPATITTDPSSNFWEIRDNVIVNAYQCLDIEGPASGIANMYSHVTDNGFGCLFKDVRWNRIDNTVVWRGNREFLLWYQGSTQVFGYVEGGPGGLGWDVNYLANIQVVDSDMVWKRIGILLNDATVTNGFGTLTFAGANWQMSDFQFNEVCQAMVVGSNSTHFNAGPIGNAVGVNVFTNIQVAADSTTSGNPGGGNQCAALTPAMFQLNSDNVSVMFIGLNAGFISSLANIGAGSSGFLEVNGASVQKYSAFSSNLPLYQLASGAALELCNDQFRSTGIPAGGGPYVSGSGFLVGCSMEGNGSINGPPNTTRSLYFGSNPPNATTSDLSTSFRWGFRADSSSEIGANAGSNLDLDRYDDSGNYIDSPMVLNRATGEIALNDILSLKQTTTGALPSCGASQNGWMAMVTDGSNTATWLSTEAGGGSARHLVMCDGNGHWQVR